MGANRKPRPQCTVHGCDREKSRRTSDYVLCDAHLLRLKKHGDVRAHIPIAPRTRRAPDAPASEPAKAVEPTDLTTGQVAALFNVHKTTIKKWARSGRLPSRRSERGYRLFDPAIVFPLVGRGTPDIEEPEYVATCRVCGCTDQESCFGGCTWVAAQTNAAGEICSRCASVASRRLARVGAR